jgi:hypothetical protein
MTPLHPVYEDISKISYKYNLATLTQGYVINILGELLRANNSW